MSVIYPHICIFLYRHTHTCTLTQFLGPQIVGAFYVNCIFMFIYIFYSISRTYEAFVMYSMGIIYPHILISFLYKHMHTQYFKF